MKKLLIMASLFWPQRNGGGPPVSIMNLVMSIKDQFDISIISNNHEIGDDKPLPGIAQGWNTFPFGKAWYVPKRQHTFQNITMLIESVQPDVIYQNSFFSYNDLLPVLAYKKRHRQVKVIVAPRGEFYPERFRCGRLKKALYCKMLKTSGLLNDIYFQGTGQEECDQEARLLGIPAERLLNIQNLSVVSGVGEEMVEKVPGRLKLVYIARVHPTKNTLNAIRWLAQLDGQVTYDIYGPIEDQRYWQECCEAIESLPQNIRVNYMGMADHDKVGEIICGYHAYYMPTFGENYGHSIVESMLVGRPVVISDQTPWSDVDGTGGYSCPVGEAERFVSALNKLCSMDQPDYSALCAGAKRYIAEKLNTGQIIKDYIKAFDGE